MLPGLRPGLHRKAPVQTKLLHEPDGPPAADAKQVRRRHPLPERHVQQNGARGRGTGRAEAALACGQTFGHHPCSWTAFPATKRLASPLQLCERCQEEILNLQDCTTPTWVRGGQPVRGMGICCGRPCAGNRSSQPSAPCCDSCWRINLPRSLQFGTAPLCAGECNVGDRVMARAQSQSQVPSDQGVSSSCRGCAWAVAGWPGMAARCGQATADGRCSYARKRPANLLPYRLHCRPRGLWQDVLQACWLESAVSAPNCVVVGHGASTAWDLRPALVAAARRHVPHSPAGACRCHLCSVRGQLGSGLGGKLMSCCC